MTIKKFGSARLMRHSRSDEQVLQNNLGIIFAQDHITTVEDLMGIDQAALV